MFQSFVCRLLCWIVALSVFGTSATAEDQVALLRTFVDELIPVTPGEGKYPASFQMGADDGPAVSQPAHKVTFAYPFAMAKYEVPQNLYESVMGNNPSRWKGPRNSVEMMTRIQVREFCSKLTELLHQHKLVDATEEIRLPTEAEWEYCCRAGTDTVYSFGSEAQQAGDEDKKATLLDAYGWHTGNAAGNDPPVGALKPNPWGFYDMHGYLSEFVADSWHPDYNGAPADGSAWYSKQQEELGEEPAQPVRGGSWKDRFDLLTSRSRHEVAGNVRDDAIGFRCVRAKKLSPPTP